MEELLTAYGYLSLGPQKNVHMESYRHEETGDRINVYTTTGTVTHQTSSGVFRKATVGTIEDLLV